MVKIKGIDPSFEVLAVPAITILCSLLLSFFIIWKGYSNVMVRLHEIDDSKKTKNTLQERLGVLQDFSKGTLDNQSNVVFVVLPNKNPGAGLLSQIKTLATNNGLELSLVSSNGMAEFNSDINMTTFEYTLTTSDLKSAVKFLQDLGKTAPISSIELADIVVEEDSVEVKLKTHLYWSELPTKLPSLNEPLVELSTKDRETLTTIRSFSQPRFVDLAPQQQNQQRQNPFN